MKHNSLFEILTYMYYFVNDFFIHCLLKIKSEPFYMS